MTNMIKSITKDYNVTTTVLFTLHIVALFTTGSNYCHTFTYFTSLLFWV